MIFEVIHVALETVYATFYHGLMFSYTILCEEQSPVDTYLSVPSRLYCNVGIGRLTLNQNWSTPGERASAR
jgi:hypothetical protein